MHVLKQVYEVNVGSCLVLLLSNLTCDEIDSPAVITGNNSSAHILLLLLLFVSLFFTRSLLV